MPGEKKLLTEIARKHNLVNSAKQIWRENPVLEQVTTALAEYIGLHPLDDAGDPLLETAVIHAIKQYLAGGSKADPDDYQPSVTAYLRTVIKFAAMIYKQDLIVQTSSGDIRWMPFECSATEFLARHPGAAVRIAPRSKPALVQLVAEVAVMIKIVPLSLLEQSRGEQLYSKAEEAL